MAAYKNKDKFFGMENHLSHYVPLWMIVFFTFLTVCISIMGGVQERLNRREFPETEVSGDLNVTKGAKLDGHLIYSPSLGLVSVPGSRELANFPQEDVTTIRVNPGDDGYSGIYNYEFPLPEKRDIGKKFIVLFDGMSFNGGAALPAGESIVFNFKIGTAATESNQNIDVVFAAGSNVPTQSFDPLTETISSFATNDQNNQLTITIPSGTAQTNLEFSSGSRVILTVVDERKYLLEGLPLPRGTGADLVNVQFSRE